MVTILTINQMTNIDHKNNILTLLGLIFGSLSIIEKFSVLLGLIILLMAAVNNYYQIKKNKQAYENELTVRDKMKKENEG